MAGFVVALVVSGIAVIAIGVFLVYLLRKIIKGRAENDDKMGFAAMCLLLPIFTFYFILYCMDIPSAMKGGVTVYTEELPSITYAFHSWYTVSDNPELTRLQGFNSKKYREYEKYGNYRIRYTKFNRFILELERID